MTLNRELRIWKSWSLGVKRHWICFDIGRNCLNFDFHHGKRLKSFTIFWRL